MTDRHILDRRRKLAEEQRRAFLDTLNREQLEQRIRSLASDGLTDYDIAETLRLNPEQVRRVLGERQEQRA